MQQLRPSKTLLAATFGLVLSLSTVSLPSLANGETSLIRQGLPGRRISGGVRLDSTDSCFSNFNQSLVAIMPRNNLGKTAAERPTFWFSVPETNGPTLGNFQLFDESEALIYQTSVDVGNGNGLSEFKLPDDAPALATNDNYRWVFSVACTGSHSRIENRTAAWPALGLQGWILRVEPSAELALQLQAASPEERASLFASAGLWHEQVTELINLRRSNLSNINFQLSWASLVQSNGLASHASSELAEAMTVHDTLEDTELSANSANIEI